MSPMCATLWLAGLTILSCLQSGALAQSQDINEPIMPLYQVHGSGTSNPAPLFWRVMDIMMARTKPKIAMSYRSVGSSSGASDFAGGRSAFGCGDVPIPNAIFASLTQKFSMFHVPILIGAVSVFHNVPGVGDGMYLPPCTLAKIFRRAITAWNDPEIVSANPHLPELPSINNNIKIVRRIGGSSSTYAITNYFNGSCPAEWTTQGWSVDVRVPRWDSMPDIENVTNSQGMVEKIAGIPYSIGYVESGQGLNAGLKEIAVQNVNGLNLTSADASIASQAFLEDLFPSDLGSAAWTSVNPVFRRSPDRNQWPMTLGTYLYLRQDLTFLKQSGGILKQFVDYLLSDDVAALMPEYSFIALSPSYRGYLRSLTANLKLGANTSDVVWRYEPSTDNTFGQDNYVISKQRDSYLVSTVTSLAADNTETKRTLMLGDAYQVHGSGSFVPASLIRRGMKTLQDRARVPISMTYRAVGSAVAQAEFSDYRKMYKLYNHFKVADMPLSSSIWNATSTAPANSTTGGVLQLPLGVSSLGIYYNKALPSSSLALDCVLVARLFKGSLTTWNDTALVQLNGYNNLTSASGGSATAAAALLSYSTTVYGMQDPSGTTWALTGYLAAACASDWGVTAGPQANVAWPAAIKTSYTVPGQNTSTPITTPEQMREAIRNTPNSIGYLPTTVGASSGLDEAALGTGGSNPPITSDKANLTAVAEKVAALVMNRMADNVETLVGSQIFNLAGTWPIPIVPYFFMYRNLVGYGYSGPLLRAFAEFLLSDEGAELAVESGLKPLPSDFRKAAAKSVVAAILKALTVVWDYEPGGVSDKDIGAGLYTFSANRQSYGVSEISQIQDSLAQLQSKLSAALPDVTTVACTAVSLPYTWLLSGDLEAMASSPVRVVDSCVDDPVAALQAGVVNLDQDASSRVLAVVNPGPLSNAEWVALSSVTPVIQVPTIIRPVALMYRGPPGLRLSVCSLYKILTDKNGTLWNDPGSVLKDNPSLAQDLPPRNITVVVSRRDSADVITVANYVIRAATAAGCASGGSQLTGLIERASSSGTTGVLGGDPWSDLVIGSADALLSAPNDVNAAALPSSVTGGFVTPLQAPSCRKASCVASSYTAAVDELLSAGPGALGVPPGGPSGDWSTFATQSSNGAKLTTNDVYPIFRFDFFVFPADIATYGADGALALSAIEYGTSQNISSRVNAALGPYFAGLGPMAFDAFAKPALALSRLVAPTTAAGWVIVNSATEQAQAGSTVNTLILSRAPSTAASSLDGSGTLLLAGLYDDAIRNLQAELETAWDKANLAYNIAVAALVLALVLALLALALAAIALSQTRQLIRSQPGTAPCFGAPGTKYDMHVDAPVAGNVGVEMQQPPQPRV